MNLDHIDMDKNLIYRLLRKSRNLFLGNDSDSMQKFFQYGDKIKKWWYIFYTHCPSSTKLTSVHVQHPIELELAKYYGKFLFLWIQLLTPLNIS